MSDLLFEIVDGIGKITINRPDRRNALNDKVLNGIYEAVSRTNSDPSIRLLTITGAGEKAFSSGLDLKKAIQNTEAYGPSAAYFSRSLYSNTLKMLSNCMVPVVGIANGYVLAGALGIFMACDLTLAVETAKFGLPEIDVGMFPMMVMSVLFKNVGRKKAMELLLLGGRITAQEALSYGLLNRVFPENSFQEETDKFIGQLALKPGMITRFGKTAFNAIEGINNEAIELLQVSLGNVMQTEDFTEGVTAFLQKREPNWKHR